MTHTNKQSVEELRSTISYIISDENRTFLHDKGNESVEDQLIILFSQALQQERKELREKIEEEIKDAQEINSLLFEGKRVMGTSPEWGDVIIAKETYNKALNDVLKLLEDK